MISTSAAASLRKRRTDVAEPLFRVEGLNAFYGSAHVLDDVSFELRDERPVAVIGRNGMGKTTLCAAIMNLPPPRVTGSVRFRGEDLVGWPSYRIAKRGIGYVPQGRRLFPSLTVEEHLRMVGGRNGGGGGATGRGCQPFPAPSPP